MSISATIAGVEYGVIPGSIQPENKVDDRDTLTINVLDVAGTTLFQKYQPVVVTDSILGTIFTGIINTPTMQQILWPANQKIWQLQCVDQAYRLDKELSNWTYKDQYAGTILAHQLQTYSAADHVSAEFALRWEELMSAWQQGTLSGTVATNNTSTGNPGAGDLELMPGGTLYTSSAASGSVSTVTAIAFSGTASSVTSNPQVVRQIWSGSIAGGSTDTVSYSVWVSSTSPQIVCGVDFVCSDGTTFAGTPFFDTEDVSSSPTEDLSGLANDQWYARSFTNVNFSGKTIVSANLVLAGTQAGNYAFYVHDIKYNSTNIFTGTLNTNTPLSNVGYSNISLSVVQAASSASQQIVFTPGGSYSGVTLVQGSQVSWVQIVPSGTSILVESSVDNQATWQAPTSGNAVPNLLAGVQISLVNLAYRVTLNIGKDPTQVTLGYSNFVTVIAPTYAMTKTDLMQAYGNAISGAIGFGSGTLTNTQVVSNQLTLSGFSRNYNTLTGAVNDQTLFGGGGITPQPFVIDKQLQLRCNVAGGNDVRSRMDPAGNWQNFTLECDVQVPDGSLGDAGLVYRTANWGNNNDTYAYVIAINSSTLQFGRGTNSTGAGAFTSIQSVSLSLTANSTHRLKAVVNGNSHTFYVDGVQIISATDSTWTATGEIGMRVFQSGAPAISSLFNNFAVRPALSGTWQSSALSISSPTTYGNSVVAWDVDGIPDSSCTITMQSSIDGGSTFQSVTNGGAIPNLTAGQSLSAKTLILKATLTCTTTPTAPALNGVSVFVLQQYSSSGTRSTAPLAWDSMIRGNVVGGFGTATNGATYTQTGTGTVALTSDEATISNTTGDVHMQIGTTTQGDTDGTVRFQLSASTITAGMELRYTNANTYYRLAVSSTTISIVKAGGPVVTLATASLTTSINTWYRMRFRVTGTAPVSLQGRVWADGASEPSTWNISATD